MKRTIAPIIFALTAVASAFGAQSPLDANPACMEVNGPDCVIQSVIVPQRVTAPPSVITTPAPTPAPPVVAAPPGPSEMVPGTPATAPPGTTLIVPRQQIRSQ